MSQPNCMVSALLPTALLDVDGSIYAASSGLRAMCYQKQGHVQSLEDIFLPDICNVVRQMLDLRKGDSSRIKNVAILTSTGLHNVDVHIWWDAHPLGGQEKIVLCIVPLVTQAEHVRHLVASVFEQDLFESAGNEWCCGLIDHAGRPILMGSESMPFARMASFSESFPAFGDVFLALNGAEAGEGSFSEKLSSYTQTDSFSAEKVFYLTRRGNPDERWFLVLRPVSLGGVGRAFAFQLHLYEQSAQPTVVRELTELVEQHRMLLWRIGHDIRDPLNALLGVIQLYSNFAGGAALNIKQMKHIADCAAKQISDILSDAATIPKIDVASHSAVASASVLKCLQTALTITEGVLPQNRVLTHGIPGSLAVKATDAVLTEIFMNLLHNALKYSPPNSSITVSALEKAASNCVEITLMNTIDQRPMPSEADVPVHEGSGRAIRQHDGVSTGWGLGLTICRFLISRLSGRLEQRQLADGNYLVVILLPSATGSAVDSVVGY